MPQENESNKAEEESEGSKAAAPSRVILDAACLRMAEAALALKDRCDEFEALLLVPRRDLGAIRLAQVAVRAAGMRSMGLTTAYLTELNQYMKALEEAAEQ